MKKQIFMISLIAILSLNGFAEVTFVHHFDDVTSATPQERLAADYAKGDNLVHCHIISPYSNSFPDTNATMAKFGSGGFVGNLDTEPDYGLLNYKAEDLVSFGQGSFECWAYPTVANRFMTPLFLYGRTSDAGKYQLAVRTSVVEGDSSMRGWAIWVYRNGSPPSDATVVSTAYTLDTWQYVSADWKLDSDNANENFMRLWVNGQLQDVKTPLDKLPLPIAELDEDAVFGLFTVSYYGSSVLSGYGDEVRITDGLISDLYTLDGSGNYTPPSAAFTTPPIINCADELKYNGGYLGDVNGDCIVDELDMRIISDEWLECINPADANCN